MANEYDNPLGPDFNVEPKPLRTITQANLDRRLFQSAVNAVLSRLLAPYGTLERTERLEDFPAPVRGKVKAIMKAFDAILLGRTPFTVYINEPENLIEIARKITAGERQRPTIADFAMGSSDGATLYTGITAISCKCLGSHHHNLCYHRWAYIILADYIVLLKAHEHLVQTYNDLGLAFQISLYDKDETDSFVDAMMNEPIPPGTTTH